MDVPSIDEALRAIERLGGSTVVPKQPVGEMGFTAYVKDTEGNVVGLWETAPPLSSAVLPHRCGSSLTVDREGGPAMIREPDRH